MSAMIISTLGQEKAHEWLPAGLADDALGGLIALQLTLATLLQALGVTLSLLLRFSSLTRG
jgi:hypothetical protein